MSKSFIFPAPVLLTTSEDVAACCDRLRTEPFITIDTEFVRERTYWPQLCLVQLAGSENVVLIDACAPGIDLAPLDALLAQPDCVKVFHAARQDMEIFLHLFGRLPVNVFDTQIAAMVAGFGDQVGYDSLVSALTGKMIDKAHRFSDWAARPLSKEQLAYASADVTYLRVVYTLLQNQLQEQKRLSWVKAELQHLVDVATFRPDPYRLWERLKARTNSRRVLGILREITAWREIEAQKANLPRQRIIRDESLLEIAAVKPVDKAGLARIRGVSRQMAESETGQGLLAAIARGRAADEADLPDIISKKRSDRQKIPQGAFALLKVLLAARCEEQKVAPRLVASNDELERLVLGETEGLSVLEGWRSALFGHEAQALLAGEIALFVDNGALRFQPRL